MGTNGGRGRTANMKPGIVKSHTTLSEPKVSAQIVYKRGVSIMWITPREAREFGENLIKAADKCIRHNRSD